MNIRALRLGKFEIFNIKNFFSLLGRKENNCKDKNNILGIG